MSAFRIGEHFFQKILVRYDKSCNFALTKKTRSSYKFHDPVVQLVRMPPCHGGGRGFESRPDRITKRKLLQNPLNLVDLKGFYFAPNAESGKNLHKKGFQFGVLF